MEQTWIRIKQWLANHAKHLLDELNTGATPEVLAQLESMIGTSLPEDFQAFYQLHNGQSAESGGLIDTEELLSIERIIDEWTIWNNLLVNGEFEGIESEPSENVKNDWWNQLWIPFTYDGSGNHYCLDLDPAAGGKRGQVIRMWHDAAERELIANSFTKFIQSYAADLEQGKYVYSEDWHGIINREDADTYN